MTLPVWAKLMRPVWAQQSTWPGNWPRPGVSGSHKNDQRRLDCHLRGRKGAVVKVCKALIAILLLPLCIGAGWTLWRVVRESGDADTIWVATLSGAACWCVIYM